MIRFWEELKATEFGNTLSDRVAVLPLAAVEQHGPHLPLGVDSMIADHLVKTAATALPEESNALFLPLQRIALSPEHQNFPGSLSGSWKTMGDFLTEIGAGVAKSGIRKLLLITSHGGNLALMDIVGRELRAAHDMLVVSTHWEKLGLPRKLPDTGTYTDIHGGEAETSIMLAIRPDLVDMSKAQDYASGQSELKAKNKFLGFHSSPATISWMAEDLNPLGVVGDASASNAADGQAMIDAMVEGFCTLIAEIEKAAAPKKKGDLISQAAL